jgi:hypothetical protein
MGMSSLFLSISIYVCMYVCVCVSMIEFLPFHLKEVLYGSSLAYLNFEHHYFWGHWKVKTVTWTQAVRYCNSQYDNRDGCFVVIVHLPHHSSRNRLVMNVCLRNRQGFMLWTGSRRKCHGKLEYKSRTHL